MPRNILHVTSNKTWPLRTTLDEYHHCFKTYLKDNVYYLNLAFKKVPAYVLKVDYDLIIFSTLFMGNHWHGREKFRQLMQRAHDLKQLNAIRICLPQDEFIQPDLLCEFINEFDINYVFSVVAESEWAKVYRHVDFEKVKFIRILPGYIDDNKIEAITQLARTSERTIDIGYRAAGQPYYWFGRHGRLKQLIADEFQRVGPQHGLNVDISTDRKDIITGTSWYKFLCQCKYTIGVMGGTSLIDYDGSLYFGINEYMRQNPGATFEEVEQIFFPGLDGHVKNFMITPRVLEAALTQTCQILVEGDYNGAIKPGRNYIELKKDFSNLDDVLELVKQDRLRTKLVNNTYDDIVLSGKYSYNWFVNFILETCLDGIPEKVFTIAEERKHLSVLHWMDRIEKLEWFLISIYSPIYQHIFLLLRSLKKRFIAIIKSIRKEN